MIISRKIGDMFKFPGFVNIDYLLEKKIYVFPSKILNALNNDWRKWVKPLSMFDGGEPLDPNFGRETIDPSAWAISISTRETIYGCSYTCPESGIADSITIALKRDAAGSDYIKAALYLQADSTLTGKTPQVLTTLTTTMAWYTFPFAAPKPDLVNAAYVIVGWAKYSDSNIRMTGAATGTNRGKQHIDLAYNSFPDPATFGDKYWDTSIYCTYSLLPPANPLIDKPLVAPILVGRPKIR